MLSRIPLRCAITLGKSIAAACSSFRWQREHRFVMDTIAWSDWFRVGHLNLTKAWDRLGFRDISNSV